MIDHYDDREQTQAKHFILKRYLQTLVFKWLSSGANELTYVDAFSGPWNSRAEDFADTSFMIAINVLKDAHAQFAAKGTPKKIHCCFVEKDSATFEKLQAAVKDHNSPDTGFHVVTLPGRFEDNVEAILDVIAQSFALIFIDPTGWTGYPYDKISPVLQHAPGEVLLNFMYDFFNRFVATDDPVIIASFDQVLGGPGWKKRLNPSIAPGLAAEQLCKLELQRIGRFRFVLSATIEKTEADRPHFSLVYGTRNRAGLIAFRDVQVAAMKGHAERKAAARDKREVSRTGQGLLFSDSIASGANELAQRASGERRSAKALILEFARRPIPSTFAAVVDEILQRYMLRETDVKNLCVDLAEEGKIAAPWKNEGLRKPRDSHVIEFMDTHAG